MRIEAISKRNYAATVRRGQIVNKTSVKDFTNKITDELLELKCSVGITQINPFDVTELADIALVCFSIPRTRTDKPHSIGRC